MANNYFLMKRVIKVAAQALTLKEKSLHYLSDSTCGTTDPFAYDLLFPLP